MIQVGMHEAKTHFSQLVAQTLAGEEVVITRMGTPVIAFVPVHFDRPRLGFAAGQIEISDDFDNLPDWFLEEFEK